MASEISTLVSASFGFVVAVISLCVSKLRFQENKKKKKKYEKTKNKTKDKIPIIQNIFK